MISPWLRFGKKEGGVSTQVESSVRNSYISAPPAPHFVMRLWRKATHHLECYTQHNYDLVTTENEHPFRPNASGSDTAVLRTAPEQPSCAQTNRPAHAVAAAPPPLPHLFLPPGFLPPGPVTLHSSVASRGRVSQELSAERSQGTYILGDLFCIKVPVLLLYWLIII